MNKIIIAVVIVILIAGGGYFLLKARSNNPQSSLENSLQPSASASPSSTEQGSAIVRYNDNGFTPATLTINQGETVLFKNESSRSMWVASAAHPSHRVYSGTSLEQHCPDTSGMAFDQCGAGGEYSFPFAKTGTWQYHNHLNPSDTGTILVQ
ncbi:MAG: hypothetical protein HYW95_01860 [Candidatus Wildermuthbacteria bacterium]|nr:hypothetical protein [Candidatus Wildermuthbacteria bacterium]